MGYFLKLFGRPMTRLPAGPALIAGCLAWSVGAALVVAVAIAVDRILQELAQDRLLTPGLGLPVAEFLLGILLKPLFSWRMLRDEVANVERRMGQSLSDGRAQLQRLVSRDVALLNETEIRESAIETLAENLNDSLVAPLFWFAIGGLEGAALYRFANTADAMWGYRGEYEWAGKAAAKIDDLMNWLPARLTALLICLAAGRALSLAEMRHQASQTPSPNGGWPMGTMALLGGIRLGKPGVYCLNEGGRPPRPHDLWQALRWSGGAVGGAATLSMAGLLLQLLWHWREM
jgi:adenosylcobinamide-phosphate synthase